MALPSQLSTVSSRLSDAEPTVSGPATLTCPIRRPGKVIGMGLNYTSHERELTSHRSKSPSAFAKFSSSLNGPFDPILVDLELTAEVDYEVELAIVIGREARRVSSQQAGEFVLGYAVANDVSARDLQRSEVGLTVAKGLDTFCPVGPWITTADEVHGIQDLGIRSFVNGERRQAASTSEMRMSVGEIIEYLTGSLTLFPGDVILSGSPAGTGIGMTPPRFLHPGDLVRCEIDQLGYIENRVGVSA